MAGGQIDDVLARRWRLWHPEPFLGIRNTYAHPSPYAASYIPLLYNAVRSVLGEQEFLKFGKLGLLERLVVIRKILCDLTGYEELHDKEEIIDAMRMIDNDDFYAFMIAFLDDPTIELKRDRTPIKKHDADAHRRE